MPGIWTEQRRARAREIALQVQPWLKSTGPKSIAGKATVSMNGYRGGIRPARRAAKRECKLAMKNLDQVLALIEMEERIDAWIGAQVAAGQPLTTEDFKRAKLKEMAPPLSMGPIDMAYLLRPLQDEYEESRAGAA